MLTAEALRTDRRRGVRMPPPWVSRAAEQSGRQLHVAADDPGAGDRRRRASRLLRAQLPVRVRMHARRVRPSPAAELGAATSAGQSRARGCGAVRRIRGSGALLSRVQARIRHHAVRIPAVAQPVSAPSADDAVQNRTGQSSSIGRALMQAKAATSLYCNARNGARARAHAPPCAVGRSAAPWRPAITGAAACRPPTQSVRPCSQRRRGVRARWLIAAAVSLLTLVVAGHAAAQGTTRRITGRIVDSADHQPLAAAQVLLTGTTIGTITTDSGTFALRVPSGASLSVRRIGYRSSTVKVADASPT